MTKLVAQADEYTSQQRFEEALGIVENAVALFPHHISLRIKFARLSSRLKRFDEADTILNDAIDFFSETATLQLERSRIASEAGRPEQAIKLCLRAIELNATHFSAWCDLTRLHRNVGRLKEAIDSAKTALELDPKHPGMVQMLLGLLQTAGRHAEANEVNRQLSNLLDEVSRSGDASTSEIANVYYIKARNYYQKRNYDEVIRVCRQAEADAIEDQWLLAYHAKSLAAEGNYSEAETRARRLTEMNPNDARSWTTLARIYQKSRAWTQAADAWTRVTELDGTSTEAWHSLLRLEIGLRHYDQLPLLISRAEEQFADDARRHLELASVAARLDMNELMDRQLRSAVAMASQDVGVLSAAATIKFEDGRVSEALDLFTSAEEVRESESGTVQAEDAIAERMRKCRRLVELLSAESHGQNVLVPEDLIHYLVRNAAEPYQAIPGKVMIVTHSLSAGGAERQVINTLSGLVSQESSVTKVAFVCKAPREVDKSEFFYAGSIQGLPIRHLSIADGGDADESRAIEMLGSRAELIQHFPDSLKRDVLRISDLIARERPAVVHAWQDRLNVSAGVAAMLSGTPRVVLGARNVPPDDPQRYKPGMRYLRSAYCSLLDDPRCVLTHNSRAGASAYSDWLDCDASQFPVVYNGVDFEAIEQGVHATNDLSDRCKQFPSVSGPVIGCVARLIPQKGLKLWLETAKLVAQERSDVSFVIVGEGPQRNELEQLARDSEIDGRILFPGRSVRVGAWYEWMDLFFLSSVIEGLPNVVIEALGMGVPCVSTRAGGIAEIIVEGQSGWIVDQKSHTLANALSKKLVWCIEHPDWMQNAAQFGRQDVRNRFSIRAMIENTLSIYDLK